MENTFRGYQLAFHPGLGTDTALHKEFTKIEGSLHNGQFTLGIKGTFDNATYQSIKEAL